MRYGLTTLWTDDVADYRATVQRAESLGYHMVGHGDTPTVYRNMWVALAVAAQETERMRLATWVTMPTGRHPLLLASAVAALQELSCGRLVVGIGTGASGPAALGRGAATLDDVRAYTDSVRSLLRGEAAEWGGATIPPLTSPVPAPMFLAAYGPRARRLAGALADGVILSSGPASPLLAGQIDEVRQAAEAAGRSPDSIEIWLTSRCAIHHDREQALAEIAPSLASAACYGLDSAAQMSSVPDEFHGPIRDLRARYLPTDHCVSGGPNAVLLEELGLTAYLAARFAIVGSIAECRAQIDIARRLGVSGIQISAWGDRVCNDDRSDDVVDRFALVMSDVRAVSSDAQHDDRP